MKEGYAGGHASAVGAIALAIATELRLSAADRRSVELGALLHDVGKLSIPDRVLMKPGPLNELEWEAMRRHATLGERLLARIVQQPAVLAALGAIAGADTRSGQTVPGFEFKTVESVA